MTDGGVSARLELAVAGLLAATLVLLWTRYGQSPLGNATTLELAVQFVLAVLTGIFLGRAITKLRTSDEE
jgi:hypothetical protein